jgi:hypothetical protein
MWQAGASLRGRMQQEKRVHRSQGRQKMTRFLSSQAFAGANVKEKASGCSFRNDGRRSCGNDQNADGNWERRVLRDWLTLVGESFLDYFLWVCEILLLLRCRGGLRSEEAGPPTDSASPRIPHAGQHASHISKAADDARHRIVGMNLIL